MVPFVAPPPMTVLPPPERLTWQERLAGAYRDAPSGGPYMLVNKANFDAWLAGLPESENVEDRRGEPDLRHYNHKNPKRHGKKEE